MNQNRIFRYPYVYYDRNKNKYEVIIYEGKKRRRLGRFGTAEDAFLFYVSFMKEKKENFIDSKIQKMIEKAEGDLKNPFKGSVLQKKPVIKSSLIDSVGGLFSDE